MAIMMTRLLSTSTACIFIKGVMILLVCGGLKINMLASEIDDLQKKISKSHGSQRVELLINLVDLEFAEGRYDNSLTHAKELYAYSREIKRQDMIARSLFRIGKAAYFQKNLTEALDYTLQADVAGIAVLQQIERYDIYMQLALIYGSMKKYNDAEQNYSLARQIAIDIHDTLLQAKVFYERGKMYRPIDPKLSLSYVSEGLLTLNTDTKNDLYISLLIERALAYKEIKSFDKAVIDIKQATEYSLAVPNIILQVRALFVLGEIYFDLGNINEAFESLNKAFEKAQSINDYHNIGHIYYTLGKICAELRYHDKATDYFNKAIDISSISIDIELKIQALIESAKIYITNNQYEKAGIAIDQAVSLSDRYALPQFLLFAKLYQGILFIHKKQFKEAQSVLIQVQKQFRLENNTHGLALSLYALAMMYDAQGKTKQAAYSIDEALTLITDNAHRDYQQIIAFAGTVYAKVGDHKKAVKYYEQYAQLQDRQDILMQQFSDQQLKYEVEQNKKEIVRMESTQKKKDKTLLLHRIVIILISLSLLGVSFLFIKNYIFKPVGHDLSISSQFLTKHGISGREAEIIQLIAIGMTNKETSQKLFIAEGTVKQHMNTIFKKLNVRNRIELLNYIRQNSTPAANDQTRV